MLGWDLLYSTYVGNWKSVSPLVMKMKKTTQNAEIWAA